MSFAILIPGCQVAVHIFLPQVIRGRQAYFGRRSATDTNFLFFPHPQFRVRHLVRLDGNGGDPATQGGVGRSPGFRAPLQHLAEDVVGHLAVTFLDTIQADLIGEFDGSLQAAKRRNIGAADALKAFSTDFSVFPAFGGNGVPVSVVDLVADILKAGAFGRL